MNCYPSLRRRPAPARTLYGAIALAAALAMPASAAEQPARPLPTAARLQTASAATVVLVPPSSTFYGALDEAGLRRFGCAYSSVFPAAVSQLAGILERAGLRATQDEAPFDHRNGVFLTLADGTEVAYLFGKGYAGAATVRGEVRDATGRHGVVAAPAMIAELNAWARMSGTVQSRPECQADANAHEP